MKKIITYLLLVLAQGSLAQGLFSGKITDLKGEPVIGANVYLKYTYDGATTDLNGRFNFKTDEQGEQILIISYVGFEEYQITVDASKGNQNLEIKLKESINKLEAVVISAGSFTAGEEASREVLKPLDIATTAGATADIAGALNTLPGTQTVGETGRLFIRGGEGKETKTFIDGIAVLHPYSSSAPNTPGRGRFSPFMFSGMSFSTGGYSAEYGQALSSALILKSKDVPEQTRTDLSVMSVGGGITHTQKLNSGALVAGLHYTNLAPYFKIIEQNLSWDQAPESYQGDIIFRKKLKNNDVVKLYSNISYSNFSLNTPNNVAQLNNGNNYFYINSTYKKLVNEKWSINSGISLTSFKEDITVDQDKFEENEQSIHIKTVAAHDVSNNISLVFGAEHFIRNYDFTFENEFKGQLDFKEDLTAVFAETDIYTSNKFVTRIGVRGEYNDRNEDIYIVPRISLAYKLNQNSQFSLAYGQFNQATNNEHTRINNKLEDEQASHYIINYQKQLEGKTFRIEGYYKNYKDLVKFDPQRKYLPIAYDNYGKGYAKGFDLFWRDNKTFKGVDYWISYSFLDTERDYRDFPEQAVPIFASSHNFSVVGKYFIQSLKTQVGATYSFTSGRPYHDPNYPGFNNKLTKAYHDLSGNFSYLFGPNVIIHGSVTNVLGIKNVFGYKSDEKPNEDGHYNLYPIKPPALRFFFIGIFITLSKEKTINQLPNL